MSGCVVLVRKAYATQEVAKALQTAGGKFMQVKPLAWGKGSGYSHDGYVFHSDLSEDQEAALSSIPNSVLLLVDGDNTLATVLANVGLQDMTTTTTTRAAKPVAVSAKE